MKKKCFLGILSIFLVFLLMGSIYFLYLYNVIPHKMYDNAYFGIENYISDVDKDFDGVDDQSDILKSARKYLDTNPVYESKYYSTGYPSDNKGVCTDVVGFALLGAGYNLMELVNEDIRINKSLYQIDIVDKNIDFRRVRNLDIFFKQNGISLTLDINKLEEWQGGDIVVFSNHIGIVSDKRNYKGIPFILHHGSKVQMHYEEDILELRKDIIGHYRIS